MSLPPSTVSPAGAEQTPSATALALGRFPYGAVYFRKSNPPSEDWERDYETAAADGMNAFRHWFMWSAIEPQPGVYEWDEYDRQLELAQRHGITTIIAELTKTAPEWVFRTMPHARYVRRNGTAVGSNMFDSASTGGNPGVCLDNDDAREAAGAFLRALVLRYRDHPAMGGYDVWNECNFEDDVCFCAASDARFREWLRAKYGEISALREAWGRYAVEWEDIVQPRHGNVYGDVLDWLAFRRDNAFDLMRWRVELIRSLDPLHPITAHGVAATFGFASARGADDWRAASEVDVYGMTFVPARRGDDPWVQPYSLDLVRAASRGKPFWHAELQGGPLWLQPQVVGRPREDGRIASPSDVRYWNLVSFAHGATGLFYLRWRPLLNGPLFGAFGPYAADGARTDRSEAASSLAKWATDPAQADLWRSRPLIGDVAIVYAPESQDFAYALDLAGNSGATADNTWGKAGPYSEAVSGAWRAFFDCGVRPDFVHIDDIDDYEVLYLPFPVMLSTTSIDRIRGWVQRGGALISEGLPGYFSDGGWMSPSQPRAEFADLFGSVESDVEFAPDLNRDLTFTFDGAEAPGGWARQTFAPTSGDAVGRYEDGTIAAVDATFGDGRTRLVGTFPSIGYANHEHSASRAWFASALKWAGARAAVRASDPELIVRLHSGAGGTHVWVLNPTREPRSAAITLTGMQVRSIRLRRDCGTAQLDGDAVSVEVPARDAVVLTVEEYIR